MPENQISKMTDYTMSFIFWGQKNHQFAIAILNKGNVYSIVNESKVCKCKIMFLYILCNIVGSQRSSTAKC